VLWQARVGDIAAMWLTMWGVSLVVFFVFGFLGFRGRARVGSIWFWTILLIISAIVAPLIWEIGTSIGIKPVPSQLLFADTRADSGWNSCWPSCLLHL
jgi:membrane protease YdiL (CAAX protease family)